VAKTGKKGMYEELMEEVVSEAKVRRALKAVKGNGGAPGMDGMKTTELEEHLKRHWLKIRAKLLAGTYAVTPVKRVEIAKPNGGVRQLGIPTVLDRWIQHLLLQALSPIFEAKFSESSYGYRPGRSVQDAVQAARENAVSGNNWVVVIRDKRVLKLIGRYLRSGILVEGVVIRQAEGTPQGGPLTPRTQKVTLSLSSG
jgi:retron-type reverse transcriptase